MKCQILILTCFADPFNADVSFKFELFISISFRDMTKETDPMVVQLCHTTSESLPEIFFILVGFYVSR
jgi:hypothetical protein